MFSEELKAGTKIALGLMPISEILSKAHNSKETVVLSVKNKDVTKNIFIKDGQVVFANSNAKSDGLRQLLINEKRLSDSQAANVEAEMKASNSKFLDALLSLGYYPKDKIADLITRQVKHIVIECHGMVEGTLEIIKNDSIFSKISQYKIEMHQLVTDGVKKYLSVEKIQESIPALVPSNYFIVLPKAENDSELEKICPEEKGLITIIGSTPKISEIFSLSFLKKDEIFKYLYCLKIFRLIDIETGMTRNSRILEKSLNREENALKQSILKIFEEMNQKNFYEILEVLEDASERELDEAFDVLKEKYAPHKYQKLFWEDGKGVPDNLFAKIALAHSVLSNTKKRMEYNSFMGRGEAHKYSANSAVLGSEEALRLAKEASARNDFKTALKHLEKAFEHAPSNTNILCDIASINFRVSMGKDTEYINKAIEVLKKAHDIDPKNYRIFVEFGKIFKDLKKNDQSTESFRKALLLNPNCAEAIEELKGGGSGDSGLLRVKGLFSSLDKLNYYQILNLDKDATNDEIKSAYHEATRTYHPDKHIQNGSEEIAEMTKVIYKRIVEAYMVLKNSQKRQEYNDQLGEFKGEQDIRLKDASDVVQKKEKTEIGFKTAYAKKFYELGLTSLGQKKLNSAKINFQLALKAEPDNVHVKRKIKEVIDLENASGDIY